MIHFRKHHFKIVLLFACSSLTVAKEDTLRLHLSLNAAPEIIFSQQSYRLAPTIQLDDNSYQFINNQLDIEYTANYEGGIQVKLSCQDSDSDNNLCVLKSHNGKSTIAYSLCLESLEFADYSLSCQQQGNLVHDKDGIQLMTKMGKNRQRLTLVTPSIEQQQKYIQATDNQYTSQFRLNYETLF